MALAAVKIENGVAEIVVGPTPDTGPCTLPSDLLSIFGNLRRDHASVVVLRLEESCVPDDAPPSPAVAPDVYLADFGQAIMELERMTMPTLAVVPGDCVAGAFQLALSCDLIIASRNSQFSFPETALGLPSLHAGVAQLADCIGPCRAIEFAFFGAAFDAEELERLNIISRVVDEDRLTQEAHALASRLAAGPTEAYAATKSMLRSWRTGGVGAARAAVPHLLRSFRSRAPEDAAMA